MVMENRKKLLEQAVACIMANWPALEITVENYIGGSLGKEKAKWLIEVTSEFITTDECGKYQWQVAFSWKVNRYLCFFAEG